MREGSCKFTDHLLLDLSHNKLARVVQDKNQLGMIYIMTSLNLDPKAKFEHLGEDQSCGITSALNTGWPFSTRTLFLAVTKTAVDPRIFIQMLYNFDML